MIGRQDARKPETVHGQPREFAHSVMASCFGIAASASIARPGSGIQTGRSLFALGVDLAVLDRRGRQPDASCGSRPQNIMSAYRGPHVRVLLNLNLDGMALAVGPRPVCLWRFLRPAN